MPSCRRVVFEAIRSLQDVHAKPKWENGDPCLQLARALSVAEDTLALNEPLSRMSPWRRFLLGLRTPKRVFRGSGAYCRISDGMDHTYIAKSTTAGNAGEDTPVTFTASPGLSAFSVSPAEFLASRPDIHNLIAGCMVFRPMPGSNSSNTSFDTLLLRRAPSDSFPLKWEIPAGTADPSVDSSILGVAVRELWEETQLQARRFLCTVGLGLPDGVTSLSLTGEVEDARMDTELDMCSLRLSGQTWAVVTFIADVDDRNREPVLRPDEHVAWAWVNEDEIREGKFRGEAGDALEFVSEAMRSTLLEGFSVRKEMTQV